MTKGSGDVLMGLIEKGFNVIEEGGFNVGEGRRGGDIMKNQIRGTKNKEREREKGRL